MTTQHCAQCKGEIKGFSEEKIWEKFKKSFPEDSPHDAVLICDTCYELIKAELTSAGRMLH